MVEYLGTGRFCSWLGPFWVTLGGKLGVVVLKHVVPE